MNSQLMTLIKEINADSALSSIEKSRKIQELYSRGIKKHVCEKKEVKCEHYKRGCDIVAKCCGIQYPCRKCHDANEDHEIDRFATEEIVCQECQTQQPVSNKCIKCENIFGEYFCKVCKMWAEDKDNEMFHCEDCNICRVGKRDNYVHCKTCNCCILKNIEHKCIESIFDSDCPICMENIFGSSRSVIQLKCGHVLHKDCAVDYCEENYRCPVCKKSSFVDMSNYWETIRMQCESMPVPDEYKEWKAIIYCFDCEKDIETDYHLVAFECPDCHGYNNQLISTNKNESSESDTSAESTYNSIED